MLEWGGRDAENVVAEEKWKRCDGQEEPKMGLRARGKECTLNAVISGHLSYRHLEVQCVATDPSPCAPDSTNGLWKLRP